MENQSISTGTPNIFLKKHSVVIRIWHWITFLFITASIITVLLASTLLNPRANIGMVKEQLQSKGLTVTNDQAFAVSHRYEDKAWDVHKWIGFGIAFLLLSRLAIELVQPGEEKFRSRLKNAIRLYKQNDEMKLTYRHYISVKLSYILFYALLLCMVLTGLGLAFGEDLGFSRGLHGTIKQIHSFGQYCMYAFVLVHIGGVIIADNKEAKGIVSGMVNGGMTD
jgi:Ni/Fe-hydrogenase 1 B-type cytochrome subunit